MMNATGKFKHLHMKEEMLFKMIRDDIDYLFHNYIAVMTGNPMKKNIYVEEHKDIDDDDEQ